MRVRSLLPRRIELRLDFQPPEVLMVFVGGIILHWTRSTVSMPKLAYFYPCQPSPYTEQAIIFKKHIPHGPHCDLSPSGPFRRPIAI
jgi:hypothetical protein